MFANETTCTSIYLNYKASSNINGKCVSVYTIKKEEFFQILLNFIQDRNSFEKTIIYAITLGGDTDTIATMAGAIAGACYGIEAIPKSWQASCESVEDALKFAEQLYDLSSTSE